MSPDGSTFAAYRRSADAERSILGGGGTGTAHADECSAYRVKIIETTSGTVKARLASFSSCLDCAFENNHQHD